MIPYKNMKWASGVVGYHTRLACERSPVQFRCRPIFLFLLNSFFILFFSYNNNNKTILCVPRSLDPKQKSNLVEAWIIVDPLLKKILYG